VVSLFPVADLPVLVVVHGIGGLARLLVPTHAPTWGWVLRVTMLVTVYGIDEYHQSFIPNRDASVWDVLADGHSEFLARVVFPARAPKGHGFIDLIQGERRRALMTYCHPCLTRCSQ
jgi:hypothetical protein